MLFWFESGKQKEFKEERSVSFGTYPYVQNIIANSSEHENFYFCAVFHIYGKAKIL